MKFAYSDGATPIDADEAVGLIPLHITLQRELNEWEELNILNALAWAKNVRGHKIVSVDFIKQLHRKMFDHTWTWAGTYRKSDKNIGVPWIRISEDVYNLCEDAQLWIENMEYPEVEIAVRVHHRLVFIHPFPNGNGRHARLIADLLMTEFEKPSLTWGNVAYKKSGDLRHQYIEALRSADSGNIRPLLSFAQS